MNFSRFCTTTKNRKGHNSQPMSGFTAEGSTSSNLLRFEGASVAWPLGFHLSERAFYNSDPGYHYLSDPTPVAVKIKILSALGTLSLSGQQYVLVQYWAATKSGNAYLLTTTDQPFGRCGHDNRLELYREACLHHKLYIHPDEDVAFGFSGYTFKKGTSLQTQDLHSYPGHQHPPCEAAIFDQIWGAFSVTVILANKRFGVLEFVTNTPKDTYHNDIYEVYKALEFAGFQPSTSIDPPRRTFNPGTRDRITESSKYDNYGSLARYMGLSKSEAMKRVTSRYNLRMPAKGTFSSAHKTAGIPEWPWVRNTTTKSCSTLETTIINPIPFEIATKVEAQDAHPVDDTGEWELVDSDSVLQDPEPIDGHPIDDIHEWENIDIDSLLKDIDEASNQPLVGTHINQTTHVAREDAGFSEWSMENIDIESLLKDIEDASNQPLVGTHINQTTHVAREDAGFSEWSMENIDIESLLKDIEDASNQPLVGTHINKTIHVAREDAGFSEWSMENIDIESLLKDIEDASNQPLVGTHINQTTHVAREDAGFSEWSMENIDIESLFKDIEDASNQPLDGTHINQTTHVAREDAGFSEWSRENVNIEWLLKDIEDASNQPLVGTLNQTTCVDKEDAGLSEWSRENIDIEWLLKDIEDASNQPLVGTHINQTTCVAKEDAGLSEWSRENIDIEWLLKDIEDASNQPLVGTHINQTTHVAREDAGFSQWSTMDIQMLDVGDSAYQDFDEDLMEVETVFSLKE